MIRILLLTLLLWSATLNASPCWKTIFEWNEKDLVKGHKILILPFENSTSLPDDEWISMLFPIILQEYLGLSKATTPFVANSLSPESYFDPVRGLELARSIHANYLIIGQFSRSGAVLQISTRLIDVAEGTERDRVGGQVEFPGTRTINDFLIDLVVRASKSFKKVGLTKKKLLPFRNDTSSAEALRLYILGVVALKAGTPQGVTESVKRFEGSVRNDYNYVPAYLGLALALTRQGFLEGTRGENFRDSFTRARRELEKARALRPEITARREREAVVYLKAESYYRLAENDRTQDQMKNAASEMEKVTDLLKGDLFSHQKLVDYFTQLGKTKKAGRHQEFVQQLNQCEGNQ